MSQEGIIDYLEMMQMAGLTEVVLYKDRATPKQLAEYPLEQSYQQIAQPIFQQTQPESIPEIPPVKHVRNTADNLSKTERLKLLADEVAQCTLCSLADSRKQTVFGTGNPDAKLVFVGEAPGADEDEQGVPFVGRAGQLLTDIVVKGMKLRRDDVYICNILRCRPPANRNPLPNEAAACRRFLDETLDIVAPQFICCLGAVAAQNLLQTEKRIGLLRGEVLNYKGRKVVCTYHPAYLLRNPAAKKDTWADIQILMAEMNKD